MLTDQQRKCTCSKYADVERSKENKMKKIFVGNLAWEATEDQLKPMFEAFGSVARIHIVADQYTGRSRGFGFVEMESADAAAQAINELNEKPFLGRNLRLSFAQDRPAGGGAGGPGGGGGGRQREPRGGGDRGERRGGGGGRPFNRSGNQR